MPRYEEKHRLPYSPEQMFDLVADVAKYPDFLPWCQGARVWKREGNVIYADLIIGFKMFREQFTSKVTLDPPGVISVEYVKGPLKHLVNEWKFTAGPEGGSVVEFLVDFEFKSHLFERLVGGLFNEAVRHMTHSFELRAKALYG